MRLREGTGLEACSGGGGEALRFFRLFRPIPLPPQLAALCAATLATAATPDPDALIAASATLLADPASSRKDGAALRAALAAAAGVSLDAPDAAGAPAAPLRGSWPGLAPSVGHDDGAPPPAVAHAGAAAALATLVECGVGGAPPSPGAALALAARAAAAGSPAGHATVATALATGVVPSHTPDGGGGGVAVTDRDWPAALTHFYFAAAANDTLASLTLGYRHAVGAGVPKSCAAAVLYYAAAADGAVAAARGVGGLPPPDRTRLGLAPSTASPRSRPSREAQLLHYQWFADMGNAGAARALGQLLAADARAATRAALAGGAAAPGASAAAARAAAAKGAAALRYLKRAADGGDADAMATLGHLYAAGAGGAPRSNATALAWFRRGADRGHASALYGLGYMALAGAGTPRDPAAALAAFRRAADAGLPEAHFHLGVLHLNGWGVPAPSPALAAHHFGLAARWGTCWRRTTWPCCGWGRARRPTVLPRSTSSNAWRNATPPSWTS